ncbi:C40 family peptidase [Streptomyces sp. NBC_01477]|uniref:C40 family peptidase n=1 Tax=Streptomyces sp. NBC_01477 TaxID=2976015 RepID=UPI002E352DBC|nr:C40 family peptidase [Streptomyces sp. NBC_01477]
MPHNRPRTSASVQHIHTGRRRHAAPTRPNWTRRAGIVGGVVSAIALSGAAAPAIADNHSPKSRAAEKVSSRTLATSSPSTTPLSTAVTTRQAADAIAQDAIEISVAAAQQQAADQAAAQAKAAAAAAAAADAAAKQKAAVAAKAAKARATASAIAASRSAKRTTLTAAPVAATSATATAAPAAVAPASGTKVDQLIAFLKSQLGKPYVYGATGPNSYDCSGLTQVAYGTVGVNLPRTSQEQSTAGTPVALGSLQPGDLIFWGGQGSAYHVGVFIGNGQYLDAANSSTPVGIHQMADYEPDWAVRVL